MKKNKEKSEELLKKMADSAEHMDWGESLTEPYTYKGDGELITDISSSTPLKEVTYVIKQAVAPYGTLSGTQNNIVMHLEHKSIGDENIRPEYAELIADMRKAKYRNEIICAEIENKHNMFMESLKNHH